MLEVDADTQTRERLISNKEIHKKNGKLIKETSE
jgi:hypothetical protein